jgi:hypothetical protein
MANIGALFLSLVIAGVFTLLELVTSKYPRTFSRLKASWQLWLFGLSYGAIALLITLLLGFLTSAGTVKLEGIGLSSPWGQAIAVGLSTKAFLHIRFFTLGVGTQSFPVGIETVVQVFEPWLLREIELAEFNTVREYVTPRAVRYNNLNSVRTTIKQDLPQSFPSQEKAAFEADLDKTTTPLQALELYLRLIGQRSFDRLFPLR